MRVLLSFGLLLVTGLAFPAAPTVIVISLDGIRWDLPDQSSLTAFERIERDGARAERLIPVYPSNTFPGHVSMATGTTPQSHGIIDNQFRDRARGLYAYESDASWLLSEPLWIAAERQGVKAATYFWVGSETDWQGQRATYREAPFDGARPELTKVARILEWLRLDGAARPGLIMSYFAGVDAVAHRHGAQSQNVLTQLEVQDQALTALLEGIDELKLWPQLSLILVSDHGMTAAGEFIDIVALLEAAGVGAQSLGVTVAHVYLDDPAQRQTALEVLARDERLRVEAGEDATVAPPSRTGDIVVHVEPPYVLWRPPGLEGQAMAMMWKLGWQFGGHGYDPALTEMGGIFFGLGRGFEGGARLPAVHQLQVAPTVARLLGVNPPRGARAEPVALAPQTTGP